MSNQITLPRDAEGREIPLDTKVLYDKDGNEWHVEHVEYSPHYHAWSFIVSKDGLNGFIYAEYTYLEKPTPPDSWEKLLDDLDNAAEEASNNYVDAPCCAWFNGGNRGCADCPADESPNDSCNVQLVKNIAARIRKLRGEER